MGIIDYDIKPKLTIGLIQLPCDITTDNEIPFIFIQIKDICWRMQKLKFENDDNNITLKTYENSKKNIKIAASIFIPIDNNSYGSIDIIALACTSMSFSLGSDEVQKELLNGYPNALIATDMATSILESLECFRNKDSNNCDVILITPYSNEMHKKNIEFLSSNNINIIADYNFNLYTDSEISSINPQSIIDCIKNILAFPPYVNIDAILISCNALRVTSCGLIDKMEKIFNIPIVTSNQALAWHCLHLCDKVDKNEIKNIKGYGKLFKLGFKDVF